jgi:hypothetical protein
MISGLSAAQLNCLLSNNELFVFCQKISNNTLLLISEEPIGQKIPTVFITHGNGRLRCVALKKNHKQVFTL